MAVLPIRSQYTCHVLCCTALLDGTPLDALFADARIGARDQDKGNHREISFSACVLGTWR
jgi:hypothetical protein